MKCSEAWLREWVNPKLTREQLANTLTMSGFEVEEMLPAARLFEHVVVGQVTKIEKHPKTQQLNICEVSIGNRKTVKVVCGAKNVTIGTKAPLAKINAKLPATTIKETEIQGILSQGMLCSASELGLSEENQGIFVLPNDAPLGANVRDYLQLDDYVIDISITPNRGDCLSVKGLSREISTLTNTPLKEVSIVKIKPTITDKIKISIKTKKGCPRYMGRIIRNVQADLITPAWVKERLRRSGIRAINPIVDVTNYVMLELGQPMHAFDFARIQKGIVVRQAKPKEKLALLDGSEHTLDEQTMVIADHEKPLAIAGVMGGLDSSVTLLTNAILLESAYFDPEVIAKQRQHYNLNSESAYRFERGVDPNLQRQAIERATQLILKICGGEAGPVMEEMNKAYLPSRHKIPLSKNRINRVLGFSVPDKAVSNIFDRLYFQYTKQHAKENSKWRVQIPSYRFDMALPEDLIEEIARIYGYGQIPMSDLKTPLKVNTDSLNKQNLYLLRQASIDQGYHEVISYSFVSKDLQRLLDPEEKAYGLANPITLDMSVMRTNLWPGLIQTLLYNRSRQQTRVRLFEIGTCFLLADDSVLLEQPRLAGLITGTALPLQWADKPREVDFFDIKGTVENLLSFAYPAQAIHYKQESHPALHPGQSAGVYAAGQKIGVLGQLHPSLLQSLDLSEKVFVFELSLKALERLQQRHYQEISKFPEIRRDLAILVNEAIPAKAIQDTIKGVAGGWLKDSFIFDVYQGKGVREGFKSIALALILQHPTRTLIDDEVAKLIERVVAALKEQLGAELRS